MRYQIPNGISSWNTVYSFNMLKTLTTKHPKDIVDRWYFATRFHDLCLNMFMVENHDTSWIHRGFIVDSSWFRLDQTWPPIGLMNVCTAGQASKDWWYGNPGPNAQPVFFDSILTVWTEVEENREQNHISYFKLTCNARQSVVKHCKAL